MGGGQWSGSGARREERSDHDRVKVKERERRVGAVKKERGERREVIVIRGQG